MGDEEENAAPVLYLDTYWDAAAESLKTFPMLKKETFKWSKIESVKSATDHSLLQALQVLLGLLPPVQLQPADMFKSWRACLWVCNDPGWAVCANVTWVPAAGGSSPAPPSSASRAPPVASRAPAWSSGSGCAHVRSGIRHRGGSTDGSPRWHLLLQLRDQLLLGAQLISKAADLLLVDLSVRLDLLLYSILSQQGQSHSSLLCCSSRLHRNKLCSCCICFSWSWILVLWKAQPPGLFCVQYSSSSCLHINYC